MTFPRANSKTTPRKYPRKHPRKHPRTTTEQD
jgi:hypothetical protein